MLYSIASLNINYVSGKALAFEANYNLGRSTILLNESVYPLRSQPNSIFGISGGSISETNLYIRFCFNISSINTIRNESAIGISLKYFQFAPQIGKLFNKNRTGILIGPYLSLLINKSISSSDPYLASFIINSFHDYDFGLTLNIKQLIYKINNTDIGINSGVTYGLSNIYDPQIYPLGGWSTGNKRAQNFYLFIGFYLNLVNDK